MINRFTKRHKSTAIIAAVAMTALLISSCGTSSPAEVEGAGEEITYGGQKIVPDLVFRAKDWGDPYDLKLEQIRFPSGGEAFAALLAGEVNVSNGGSGRLITVAAQRPESISLIAKWQFGGSRYSLLTTPESPLAQPSDLKGKTVAVDNGSGAYTLFQVWLEQNNLSIDDVTVIQTKIAAIGAALQSGSADVGIAWEPTASILVEKKLAERFTTLEDAGQSPNFLIVDKAWASNHREALVDFLRAAIDVGNLIKEDPAKAGEMASEVNRAEGVEASAIALADALRHINLDPEIDDASLDELARLAEELVDLKKIDAVPDFAALVDNTFLQEALGE
jgi:ABC-type nitrate/sulfonate/bicarbonate transport system substrate-binding protein